MLTKDRAICIRAVDFSETSQVVTLFARASGKITAIAKGSKRPKSPFDGPIEILSFGDIVFSDSRRDKLATLTEFQQQPAFQRLPTDLFVLNCGLFAAELLDKLTDDYDPHPDLFDQLLQFLHNIAQAHADHGERTDILALLILFQLTLLKEVGLRPILSACTNCKNPFSPAWRESYFSSSANGLLCRDCEANFPDKIPLTKNAAGCLASLRLLPRANERTLAEIEKTLIRHFTQILGRPPKMTKYICGDIGD